MVGWLCSNGLLYSHMPTGSTNYTTVDYFFNERIHECKGEYMEYSEGWDVMKRTCWGEFQGELGLDNMTKIHCIDIAK